MAATQQDNEELFRPMTVSAKAEGEFRLARYCPERAYVQLQVPKTMVVIHRVIFRISGHDQGFSDQPVEKHGTIDGSCTWFNACVLTPVGHDRVPRRIAQYNYQATDDFQKYEVRWDVEDADEVRWLSTIRPGDTIQLVPRAEYLAWVNFVNEAEIEIQGLETLKAPMLSPVSNTLALAKKGVIRNSYYRALDEAKQEVRLICLHPGAIDDPISCSIAHTNLRNVDHVKYEALSYCWGDENDRRDIEIQYAINAQGRKGSLTRTVMSITASLFVALKNLRPTQGPARIMWIDAICINQQDLEERAHQISIMREVYEMAYHVVVWLGESDESTKRAIKTVLTISGRYQEYLASPQENEALVKLHRPLLDNNAFDEFVDNWPLFEKPYFRRTWVVQEVFNAKHADVQCGRDLVGWKDLLRVSSCHGLTRLKATSGFKAVMPPLFETLFKMRKEEDTALQATEAAGLGILEVLIAGLDLDATDPRDKIFAMLQFGIETARPDRLPIELQPDLHKNTAEVFSDFTRWWIQTHKSLRVFSALQAEHGRTWQETQCVGTTISIAGRPSWSLWYRGHSNWAKSILALSPANPYRAAGTTEPDIKLLTSSPHPTVLPLQGIRVGTITHRGPYPFFQPDEDAVCLRELYIALFDPVNEQRRWARSVFMHAKEYRRLQEMPHHLSDHMRTHYEYANETGAIQCHSDCFFRTREDGVGLCVPYAREGDVIAVLYGGNVPFVLRPTSSKLGVETEEVVRYELVGECYLVGFMDGKAVDEMGDTVETFELL